MTFEKLKFMRLGRFRIPVEDETTETDEYPKYYPYKGLVITRTSLNNWYFEYEGTVYPYSTYGECTQKIDIFMTPRPPPPPEPPIPPEPPTPPLPITGAWVGFAKALTDSIESWKACIIKAQKWPFNTARIVLRSSQLDMNKLDQVLTLCAQNGLGSILDNHLLSQWVNVDHKFGTIELRNMMVNLANQFKDDPRVIAYEPANEPVQNVWASNITSDLEVIKEYATITDLMRQKDPVKPVIWMPKHNIQPGEYLRGNIIVSFHPYTYGSPTTQDEVDKIWIYREQQMRETLAKGYSGAWIGEIECKEASKGGAPLEMEKTYVRDMIRLGIERGYGFNYWKYCNNSDDGGANQDDVIASAGYNPG